MAKSSFVKVVGAVLLAVAVGREVPDVHARVVAIPDDVVIVLERTACFGECPVYKVTIDARGNITYDGVKFVLIEGRQTARIPLSRVAALVQTVDRIRFFELRDRYLTIVNPDGSEQMVTDLPTVFVTVTKDGRSKRVEDYFGTPDGLKQLERQIDEAAGTKRWIQLTEETLQQWVQEGRTFAPDELAELLQKALEQDEVGVVKRFMGEVVVET
jgi:hypothetical protein